MESSEELNVPSSDPNSDRDPDTKGFLRRALYDELRYLASRHMSNERSNHTLAPTALVHEAYLRLSDNKEIDFSDRIQFLRLASTVMRQTLVDHARRRSAQKRGGDRVQVPLTDQGERGLEFEVLALDRALDDLSDLDRQASRVVEMKVFAGMKMQEIANSLDVSKRTVESDWQMARMWLSHRLS